jgi:glycosyltransferase involved in cell wall biosynthesis
VDWVVVPSKWWENSPVIVDEALSAQTPLLVANHGGLYEKVVNKGFGVGFTPNSAASLAERFIGLTTNTKHRDDIRKVISEPRHVDDVAVELSKIYQDA